MKNCQHSIKLKMRIAQNDCRVIWDHFIWIRNLMINDMKEYKYEFDLINILYMIKWTRMMEWMSNFFFLLFFNRNERNEKIISQKKNVSRRIDELDNTNWIIAKNEQFCYGRISEEMNLKVKENKRKDPNRSFEIQNFHFTIEEQWWEMIFFRALIKQNDEDDKILKHIMTTLIITSSY